MSSSVEVFLNKLRVYYKGTNKNFSRYSNYYLLGYRNNFVFLRTSGVLDTLSRIQKFIQVSQLRGCSFWFVSLSSEHMWLAAKFA